MTEPAAAPRGGRTLGRIADLVAVVALVAVALASWPHGAVSPELTPPVGAPWWATLQDYLLDGPDAGRWAWQALALERGVTEQLDPHRMPTWTLVTVVTAAVTGYPVTLAGHLTTHLCHVLLGPVAYALSRRLGTGRVAAIGAGVLVVLAPAVVIPSRRFGVDPVVTFLWPTALLLVLACAPRPRLSPLAGGVAAFTYAAHFTTMPGPVPLLVALLVAAPAGTRARSAAGFAVGFGVAVAGIFSILPAMPPDLLLGSIAEGIAPRYDQARSVNPWVAWQSALQVLEDGARSASADAGAWIAGHAGAPWMPPVGVVALLLLGAAGAGFGARPEPLGPLVRRVPRRARFAVEWATRGLPLGLAPLLVLTPLPALFVAHAPGRYINNLLPVTLILVVRGVAVVGRAVDGRVARRVRRWPIGAIEALTAVGFVVATVDGRGDELAAGPPPVQDLVLREAGAGIDARFPPPRDVATPIPEIAAGIASFGCPDPIVCPASTSEVAFRNCLRMLASRCDGEGEIPYVVAVRKPTDERPPQRAAMDRWVLERWPAVLTYTSHGVDVQVVALPRDAATVAREAAKP